MMGIQEIAGSVFGLLSFVAAGFTVAASRALTARPASVAASQRPRRSPPVTLLKPLYLVEPELEENLRGFFRQDYEGSIQFVFGATSPSDPALRIVDALRREFPDADVQVAVGSKRTATNPKVANLMSMATYAKHELLIMSDSDIHVSPEYVSRIVIAMEEPGVGAVSLLYGGKPVGNLWSKLSAMNIECHFFPNARLGIALGLTKPCFGATIAFRRQILAAIGGFESLANVLADDYELGRAIRAHGYRVSILDSITVEHVCSQSSALSLLRQELRWARTNLLLAPLGYTGTLVTHPLPCAALALAFLGFSTLSLAALAAALASRICVVFRSARRFGWRREYFWLLPLRDTMSFYVYVASFFGKNVRWRGHHFATRADGALAPVWR